MEWPGQSRSRVYGMTPACPARREVFLAAIVATYSIRLPPSNSRTGVGPSQACAVRHNGPEGLADELEPQGDATHLGVELDSDENTHS